MEKEYYIGYVRNPNEKINDGFSNFKEYCVFLTKDQYDYKEIITDQKLYVIDNFETIDWNKAYENNSFLIGRVDTKTTFESIKSYLNSFKDIDIINYISKIQDFISDGIEKANLAHKEYIETEEKFIKKFNKGLK